MSALVKTRAQARGLPTTLSRILSLSKTSHFASTASRSASMSAWVILLSKPTPSPLTSRKNIALLHGDLDRIHEQVAGRDPVEVIGESLSFDSGFPAAGRASVPVREGRRATVVKMNDALGGDCRDVDCAPAVVDFTRAVVEGKCSAGEDRRIMPHVAIGGGIPLVEAHRRRRHGTVVTAVAERYETSVPLRRQIHCESDAIYAFACVPGRNEPLDAAVFRNGASRGFPRRRRE